MSKKNTKLISTTQISHIDSEVFSNKFLTLFKILDDDTKRILKDIFYICMKVVYFKHKRKKNYFTLRRSKKGKAKRSSYSYKDSDITEAICLVDDYIKKIYVIPPDRNPLRNFGSFAHADAMLYYERYLEGTVKDTFGREVTFDEGGISFLFDHDPSLNPLKYKEARGKRLPWLKPTIENSRGVYEVTEEPWTTYFYISACYVPFLDLNIKEKVRVKHYFLVVARKEAKKPLRFITAYHFDKELMFLKYLEPSHPFHFASSYR